MNNENKPSVIAELTAALASMAERAAAAEALSLIHISEPTRPY